MKKILLTSLLALGLSVVNANIFMNFYDDGGAGPYNPVGTTFNNIDYGVDAVNPALPFTSQTNLALVDETNATTSVTFSFSSTTDGFSNPGAGQAAYDAAKPATGWDWFVTSSTSLAETGVFAGVASADYTFSGFNASDTVTFQFVFGRSSTGTRRISFGPLSDPDLLLDNVNTASTAYFVETTVTGATSYSFQALRESTGDAASSIVAAASINVTPVPEPSTFALIGGLLALGLVMLRRRFRS